MERKIACQLFGLLADENRMQIIKMLVNEKEVCACSLLKSCTCKQATLSHHLRLLVDSSLVNARAEGKWVYYSVNREKLLELLSYPKEKCECLTKEIC